MEALGIDYDAEAAEDAERLKLGRRKGSTNKKNVESRRRNVCSVTQAGVALEYGDLPSVTYPEIALCGRSNCGKSSLLNALCGMAPDNGVASVSPRPGWTQNFQLFTCTLRDDETPFMSLLDLPGYGPAHAPQACNHMYPARSQMHPAYTHAYLFPGSRVRRRCSAPRGPRRCRVTCEGATSSRVSSCS